MIFFLSATFLLLVYLLPMYTTRLARDRAEVREYDLFGPLFFLVLFGALGVPYLYVLAFDKGSLLYEMTITPWITDLDRDVVWFVALSAAMFTATVLGLRSKLGPAVARHLPVLGPERFTPARCTRGAILALAGGFMIWGYYISTIGGLRNLWVNMALRTYLGAGMGYLSQAFMALLFFGTVLMVYRLRFRDSWARRASVALTVLAVSFVLASNGGRTPLLELVIVAFLTHHYGVRRRRRLITPGTAAVGVVLVGFILVIPLFRQAGKFERYTQSPELLGQDAFKSLSALAPQFSAFDRTSIMLNYFTVDRMWAGRSWIDLFTAPLPRRLYPHKPPVDDGVYFKEIVDGHHVVPPVAANRMQPTSWPMGNLVLYMNFGLPGLLLGCFAAGVALGAAYRYLERSGFTPMAILFYEILARLGLVLSVWGIVQLMMTFGLAILFFWTVFGRRRWPVLAPAAGSAPAPVPAAG